MFGKSLRSVSILFKYAPWLTAVKLLQIGLSAVLAPLSIYFTQQVIDTVSGIFLNREGLGSLMLWAGLLIFSMFFSSIGGGFLKVAGTARCGSPNIGFYKIITMLDERG